MCGKEMEYRVIRPNEITPCPTIRDGSQLQPFPLLGKPTENLLLDVLYRFRFAFGVGSPKCSSIVREFVIFDGFFHFKVVKLIGEPFGIEVSNATQRKIDLLKERRTKYRCLEESLDS